MRRCKDAKMRKPTKYLQAQCHEDAKMRCCDDARLEQCPPSATVLHDKYVILLTDIFYIDYSFIGWQLCSAIPSHENVCMAIQVGQLLNIKENIYLCGRVKKV